MAQYVLKVQFWLSDKVRFDKNIISMLYNNIILLSYYAEHNSDSRTNKSTQDVLGTLAYFWLCKLHMLSHKIIQCLAADGDCYPK